ncbi:MAG: NADH-quinone oxidoreductase subunit K [Holosporales bacterium]|jgi:NADH:ubiquinone oxidoreductase subunit K|nr:NADH-quinone oxidoreductase subunit K [Holosporales bacterium]
MNDVSYIILLSGFLFCAGLFGLLRQNNIIKVLISIEVMMFASIINVAYFTSKEQICPGHLAILLSVALGAAILCVVFTLLTIQAREDKTVNLIDEDHGS